jgi:hypothetical protein
MASRQRFVSPDGSQRGHTARKRDFKILASVLPYASLSSERDKKRPAYAVVERCTRPTSSARPLETKRLQRLSRKSRSHYSKRDRRSSLILRAAPATRSSSTLEPEPSRRPRAAPATSTPRALETSAPSAHLDALGPASAPLPAATFVGPFRRKRGTRIK